MLSSAALLLLPLTALPAAQDYEWPADPLVRAKLEEWQDLKFGLMMHWGVYSQWGIVESWTLCSEDQPWCSRGGADYVDYVRSYERLLETFEPVHFDPAPWAAAARAAGMKYVVFTTKHHDGFAMFGTKQSDYGITGPTCAFRDDPRADVTRGIFEAFRAQGLWTGAYFSKPDWHHDDYWAPEWATPDRCNNYDTRKYPERWQRFRDFTYRQIEELMTGYGPVDMLWLDGGWVRPNDTINDEVRAWGYDIPAWEQDIDMPRIARMAREHQPGLLIVDRTVHGPYENYRTPEQRVPDEALPYPWETCMTMSESWSWVPDADYKSVHTLVHTLIDVVAKGGNLLLNVGPDAAGRWDPQAFERLAGLATWMEANGRAIHATRPVAPYVEGPVRYTRSKDARTVYAIHCAAADRPGAPAEIVLRAQRPAPGSQVLLLESGESLPWHVEQGATHIQLPPTLSSQHAWAVSLTPE